jgi:ABC-type lipoprotein export system ATPase subunit
MRIDFNNVTPAPLAGVIDLNTNIWQKQCVFEPGGKYRIVAPSGKGKSTFIHYIYGLRFDFTGEIKLDHQETKTLTTDQWATLRQEKISIVYQDLRLFLHLTALQNIQVKTVLYKNDFEKKIDKMAEILQVKPLLSKKCETLSYGERQRIGIIRSLVQPFNWLLLDEPFSHLDKENSTRAAALIEEEVQQRKAGVILTSLGQDNYLGAMKQLQL